MEKAVRDVQRLKVWKDIPPQIPRMPKGPTPGALMTTRQMVFGVLTQQTSVTTSTTGQYILQNGSTALLGQMSFCLADLTSVTTFGSMFDRYRFEKVMVRFTTRNPNPQVFNLASPNQAVPHLYVAIDRDDSTAPSNLSDLTQYDNCIEMPGTGNLDVTLIPSVVSTIANASSTATSSVIHRSDEQWLDMAATTLPHFGIKFGVTPLQATTSNAWYFDLELWYWVSFKSTR